jgi:Uma2 family endonuclease
MATLLQSPARALSMADVAGISQSLAEDLGRIVLKTEGFSVEDYLSFDGPYMLEYVDGSLQVLPMPDALHQAIAFVLANLLVSYAKSDADARVKLSPFRVRLNEKKYREPDVCYMRGNNAHRRNIKFWIGADLVVEVISESNRDHDFHTKMHDYAAAGIPEYWIIDPEQNTVHIFRLAENCYIQHGKFDIGTIATSPSLPGFSVDVAEFFRQAAAQA